MIFGYAYPAYECFKAAENNRTDIAQVLSWCRYCHLVVLLCPSSHTSRQVNWKSSRCEPMQSSENGDINSPRQETVPKESVQLKHGRWKLFQSPQKPSNS
ncbi:hypothetical protein NC651_012056 [Populus alba x Populus x berolinensis]|nr:hypothetical protein NC651_012056 [Populus alba x Populus x berolinensis]